MQRGNYCIPEEEAVISEKEDKKYFSEEKRRYIFMKCRREKNME